MPVIQATGHLASIPNLNKDLLSTATRRTGHRRRTSTSRRSRRQHQRHRRALTVAISTIPLRGSEQSIHFWMAGGAAMGKLKSLQEQVQTLSSEELAQFRAWLLDRDWHDWDAQLEQDIQDGRLDALAEQALRDHASGKATSL